MKTQKRVKEKNTCFSLKQKISRFKFFSGLKNLLLVNAKTRREKSIRRLVFFKGVSFLFLFLITFSSINPTFAFVPPSSPPPGDNVDAPINTGSEDQSKEGWLGIGTTNAPTFELDVSGNIEATDASLGGRITSGTGHITGGLTTNAAAFQTGYGLYVGTSDAINFISGSLGIGVDPGDYKLNIDGSINFTGTLYQDGEEFITSKWTSGTGDDIYRLLGSVGIGAAPTAGKLDVDGDIYGSTITASSALVSNTGTISNFLTVGSGGGVDGLKVDGDVEVTGSIGIGTIIPDEEIHILASEPTIKLEPSSGDKWKIVKNTTGLSFYNETDAEHRMVIGDDGNVGIGTTDPNYKLQVVGNFFVADSQNHPIISVEPSSGGLVEIGDKLVEASGTLFTVDGAGSGNFFFENGKVGIGTTSPGGKLHVNSGSSFSDTPIFERSELTSNILWASIRATATKTTNMGDGFGSAVNFAIQDDAGVINPIASIGAVRAGADNTGDIIFQPLTAGLTNERMRITSGGNVGIGTTSPGAKLEIQTSNSASTGGIRLLGTTYGSTDVSYWSENQFAMKYNGAYKNVISSDGDSYFNGGNVGIGTTSPANKLDVDGSAGARSFMFHHQTDNISSSSDRFDMGYYNSDAPGYGLGTYDHNGNLRMWVGNPTYSNSNIILNPIDGNVGIGTTSPTTARLVIEPVSSISIDAKDGRIINLGTPNDESDAATKDYVDSIVVPGGGGGLPAGTVEGQTLKWSHASSVWISSSNLINNGTNVGIGTTIPDGKLHVRTNDSGPQLVIEGNRANALYHTKVSNDTGIAYNILKAQITNMRNQTTQVGAFGVFGSSGSDPNPPSSSYVYIDARPDAAYNKATLKVDSNDRVGIGISSSTRPSYKLDVRGDVAVGTAGATNPIHYVATPTVDTDAATKGYVDNFVPQARTLTMTGTSNQVNIIPTGAQDLSANREWTFSLPQNIHTLATPQFARLGLGVAADATYLLNLNGAKIHGTATGVGIGTTVPDSKLHINNALVSVRNSVDSTYQTPLEDYHLTPKGYVDDAVEAGGADGYIGLTGSHTAGGNLNMGANDLSGNTFSIPNSGYTYFNSGNVGVGTTSPGKELTIYGDGTSLRVGANDSANTNYTGRIELAEATDASRVMNYGGYITFNGLAGSDLGNGILYLGVRNGSTADTNVVGIQRNASANSLHIASGGYVGIGTTIPQATLHVDGQIRVGQYGADENAVPKSYVDDIVAPGGGGGLPAGAVEGQTLKWNNTSSEWGISSNLINNGTNVGIGTINPEGKLEVETTGANGLVVERTGSIYSSTAQFKNSAGSTFIGQYNTDFRIGSNLDLGTGNFITVNTGGGVGIGTTSPNYSLDINGGGTRLSSSNFMVDYGTYTGSWARGYLIQNSNASDQYGITGEFDGDAFEAIRIGKYDYDNKGLYILKDGNVGMGTSSPDTRLHTYTPAASGSSYITVDREADTNTNGLSFATAGTVDWYNYVTADVDRTMVWNDGVSDRMFLTNEGYLGINTSPSTPLTLANDSWISAENSAGTGHVNMFKVNSSNEIEVGGTLNIGTIGLTEDSGAVTLVNMPVSSTPAAGTEESYSFSIDSDVIAKIYAEADGTGGIQNKRVLIPGGNVGIGTTIADYKLTVSDGVDDLLRTKSDGYTEFNSGVIPMVSGVGNLGTGTSQWQDINITGALYDNGTTYKLNPSDTGTSAILAGDVGIGTTDPNGKLHVYHTAGSEFYTYDNSDGIILTNNIASKTIGLSASQAGTYGGSGAVGIKLMEGGNVAGAGRIKFYGDSTEILTITSDGNIGVGTTSVNRKLDVRGLSQFDNTNTYTDYQFSGSTVQTNSLEIMDKVGGTVSDGIYPTLTFHDYGNGGAQFSMDGSTEILHLASGAYDSAGTLATGSSFFSELRVHGKVTTTGNVGIGTDDPGAYKLNVNGTTKSTNVETGGLKVTDSPGINKVLTDLDGAGTAVWKDLSDISGVSGTGTPNYLPKWNATGDGLVDSNIVYESGGNVGIGIIDPGLNKLYVSGEGYFSSNVKTGGSFVFGSNPSEGEFIYRSGNNDIIVQAGATDILLVDGDDGYIGIGTLTPAAELDVTGEVWATGSFKSGSSIFSDISEINNSLTVGTGFPSTTTLKSEGYSALKNNVSIGTDTVGTLLHMESESPYLTLRNSTDEYVDGGAESKIIFEDHSSTSLGQIEISHDGTSDDVKGQMIFSVNNGTSLTSSLVIDSSNNVGIGTASPDTRLHTYTPATSGSSYITIDRETDANVNGLSFATAGTVDWYNYITADADRTMVWNDGISDRMFLTNEGYLGIGEGYSSPNGLLDVNNNLIVTDEQITMNVPLNLNTAGDISFASDIQFTNPTASAVRSYAPLLIEAGDPSQNVDLTLRGSNSGEVIVDDSLQVTNSAYLNGGATLSADLDMQYYNINSVDKLTVNTIDPIHEINGKEYASYVSFYVGGQKMETNGLISLSKNGKDYQYLIDFEKLEEGSDLWLFWKTIHQDLSKITVLLTPSFNGDVWYEKIGKSKILIFGKHQGEVSYSFSALRKDYKEWPNLISEKLGK